MDEKACAAALVVAFAGESSLRTVSMELVRKAAFVEDVADAVRAPSYDLMVAARALSRADDMSRLRCVVNLEKAATEIGRATAARHDILRRAAEKLACACRARCPRTTPNLLGLADEVWSAAAGAGVPRDALVRAGRALLRAGANGERAQAILDLDREATALAHAAGVRLTVLGCGARFLVRSCQDFRQVAGAIPVVRSAAEAARAEQGDGRRGGVDARTQQGVDTRARQGDGSSAGAWWSWLRRRKNPAARVDLEAALIERTDSPKQPSAPSPCSTEPGDSQVMISAIQGFALFGSIALLPYMGPDGVLKPATSDYRLGVLLIVTIWWTLVGVGVLCNSGKTKVEPHFARLSGRAGMLGVNLLVIMFCSWLLAPDDTATRWYLLAFAAILHSASFVAAWVHKDI